MKEFLDSDWAKVFAICAANLSVTLFLIWYAKRKLKKERTTRCSLQ
jgi:hypothetical protein